MTSNYENKRLWTGHVIDNNDPLMVNRVRVQFDTSNNEAILKGVPEYIDNKKTIAQYLNDSEKGLTVTGFKRIALG